MRSSLLGGSAFALAAAVALWSCGGGGSSSPSPSSPTPTTPNTPTPSTPGSVSVSIVGSVGNTAFQPNPVTAKTGDTVMFKNNDSAVHHIVMDDGSADLGDINPGETKSMTLKSMGGNFHCNNHSSMVGSINGAAAPEPPPCTTPGYCG